MDYPCNVCLKKVRSNAIFCNVCKTWIHRKCANLTVVELDHYSHIENEWFCVKCTSDMFPFSQTNDDELNYLTLGIDGNLGDLFDNCSSLNFKPFTFTDNKEYFLTDKADPDDNFYKHVSPNSLYYTDEQFKHKFALTSEGAANFSIIHFNCRSLASNFNKLKDSIKALGLQFDVIAISETWLSDNDSDNFNIDGYITFTCSRIYKKGGGVALYINNSLQHKYLPNKSKCIDNCAEAVSVEITLKNGKKVIVCCIYRAPNTELDQLSEFINNVCRNIRNKTVYMCGDFNVDLLQYDKHNATNNFIDQLYSLGLHPLITRPTRITSHSKTLIDNIFTTNLSSIIQCGLIINDMSDHLPIFQITECTHFKCSKVVSNRRRIVNDQKLNVLMNKLKETNWNKILCSEDVNEMYNTFTDNLTKIYNTVCPIVNQKTINKQTDKPWMTSSLKQACKKKNLLYRQFLKRRSTASEEKYKRYKNKLTGILRYCEKQHYTELLEKNKGNIKETWKIINSLINKNTKGTTYPT